MLPARFPCCLIVILAAGADACAAAPHPDLLASPGTQLTRTEELPPGGTGGAGPAFTNACAARLRDSATGREYLIMHSEVRTASADAGGTRSTTLQAAVGDYALVSTTDRTITPTARLRVDCTTSRVLAQLAPSD